MKVFYLRTFNWKLLRPEYRVLFDFVHMVFLSYAGTNDSVTHAKFKVMTAVVKNMNVNWARLLVNLFIE